MKIRNVFPRLNLFLSTQLGLDFPRLLRGVYESLSFAKDLKKFKSKYKGKLIINPCLLDKIDECGSVKSEYFLQDLYVAQKIYQAKPSRHLDIGSRVDGFVAHVASFRDIEVADIRPTTSVIPGIKFIRADLMSDADFDSSEKVDSISCLHALEHFGLGRYGDSIDPKGHQLGLINIAKLVTQSGALYLSMPVGIERVEFNSHRVVNPIWLLEFAAEQNLSPIELSYINQEGQLVISNDVIGDSILLAKLPYSLAIFTFQKQ
jgi:hypothetical protein